MKLTKKAQQLEVGDVLETNRHGAQRLDRVSKRPALVSAYYTADGAAQVSRVSPDDDVVVVVRHSDPPA